jgi:hypothetical protein
MRRSTTPLLGLVAMAALSGPLAAVPAAADTSSPRYAPWQGNQAPGQIDSLIENLQGLIDEADKARAADPRFIQDLRDVLSRYQRGGTGGSGAMTRLLRDDFRDGDFASNPPWTVSAGQWDVDRNRGLHSIVGTGGSNKPNVSNLLGNLLQQQGGGGNAQYASIYTQLRIGRAFSVQVDIASRNMGRVDFGPYSGRAGDSGYRVAYSPGNNGGLELQSFGDGGSETLGRWDGSIDTSNKRVHSIKLTRDNRGWLEVSLDGQRVIREQDQGPGQGYDGFLMINSDGEHWIRSVAIDGSRN